MYFCAILYWLQYFHNLIPAFLVSDSVEEVKVLVVRMEMDTLIKMTNRLLVKLTNSPAQNSVGVR